MRKSAHLSTIFAAVALLAVPAMAAPQTGTSSVITDLDCTLTVDDNSDFYEGCAVAAVSEDNLTGIGFMLTEDRSIIFVGARTGPKAVKVMGVGINDGPAVPAVGSCVSQPRTTSSGTSAPSVTCSVNLGGRTVKVEARGQ